MSGKRQLHRAFGSLLLVLIAAVASCSPTFERVEIALTSSVKEAVQDATPGQEYGYFALKTSRPAQVEDLTKTVLLVCGDAKPELDLEVAASSVKAMRTPLFQSSKVFFVNENVSCGGSGPCVSMTQNISFKGLEKFKREIQLYGSGVSDTVLTAACMEEMRQHPETILLMKKRVLGSQAEIVEIVFK
jgi:hypothetical protein